MPALELRSGNMRMHWVSAGCLLAVLLSLQARAQPEIPKGLQETYGEFATALVKGEAEKAIEFYVKDAVVLVDAQHVYRGRSAILEGFLQVYLESPAGEEGPGTDIEVDRVVVGEGAVTLAGRYSNPAGTSGIYSNTWQLQDGGDWKVAISVMTFEAAESAQASSGEAFACTQVLGFSQSLEWYGGLSLVDETPDEGAPETPSLEAGAFLPGWQGRFYPGAAVDKWTDRGFPGWSGANSKTRETEAHCAREDVDRVVFNVSGPSRPPDEWAAAVVSVAELIREEFPAVQQIVMQPVVGAPEGKCRDVLAARNHAAIVEGIRRAAQQSGITGGPEPKVANCDQFRDQLGHLTGEGAQHVRRILREHYRRSTVVTGNAPGAN